MLLRWVCDDGGRQKAGHGNKSQGDCVTRAIAVATGMDYQTVYDAINIAAMRERMSKRKRGRSHARTGVHKATIRRYLAALGWRWHPTMGIGTGCRVHLRADELPNGRLIVSCSKHLTTMINGVIHDTHDPSRDGTRCVYGFWSKEK